jgi:hypothetical protein
MLKKSDESKTQSLAHRSLVPPPSSCPHDSMLSFRPPLPGKNQKNGHDLVRPQNGGYEKMIQNVKSTHSFRLKNGKLQKSKLVAQLTRITLQHLPTAISLTFGPPLPDKHHFLWLRPRTAEKRRCKTVPKNKSEN